MRSKIEKIDAHKYPENLGNRPDNQLGEHGLMKLGTPPLEYALLEKIIEIIDHLNK